MANPNLNIDQLMSGTIYDSAGDKVGKVSQVYLDDATGDAQFATVSTGFFGSRDSFVPLREARVDGESVHVPYSKDQIKNAPNIDADRHIDESEEDELFRYYHQLGDAGIGHDVDRDRKLDDTRERVTSTGTDTDTESVVRREERLNVGTERSEAGRVRLRKHVVTSHETVTVPVEREEIEIVREPLAGGKTGGELGEDEIEVVLHEERPVVNKEVVDAERVGIQTRTHTTNEQVSADLAKEEIEIDRDGIDGDDRTRR